VTIFGKVIFVNFQIITLTHAWNMNNRH